MKNSHNASISLYDSDVVFSRADNNLLGEILVKEAYNYISPVHNFAIA